MDIPSRRCALRSWRGRTEDSRVRDGLQRKRDWAAWVPPLVRSDRSTTTALYARDRWEVARRWTLDGGVRWSRTDGPTGSGSHAARRAHTGPIRAGRPRRWTVRAAVVQPAQRGEPRPVSTATTPRSRCPAASLCPGVGTWSSTSPCRPERGRCGRASCGKRLADVPTARPSLDPLREPFVLGPDNIQTGDARITGIEIEMHAPFGRGDLHATYRCQSERRILGCVFRPVEDADPRLQVHRHPEDPHAPVATGRDVDAQVGGQTSGVRGAEHDGPAPPGRRWLGRPSEPISSTPGRATRGGVLGWPLIHEMVVMMRRTHRGRRAPPVLVPVLALSFVACKDIVAVAGSGSTRLEGHLASGVEIVGSTVVPTTPPVSVEGAGPGATVRFGRPGGRGREPLGIHAARVRLAVGDTVVVATVWSGGAARSCPARPPGPPQGYDLGDAARGSPRPRRARYARRRRARRWPPRGIRWRFPSTSWDTRRTSPPGPRPEGGSPPIRRPGGGGRARCVRGRFTPPLRPRRATGGRHRRIARACGPARPGTAQSTAPTPMASGASARRPARAPDGRRRASGSDSASTRDGAPA